MSAYDAVTGLVVEPVVGAMNEVRMGLHCEEITINPTIRVRKEH